MTQLLCIDTLMLTAMGRPNSSVRSFDAACSILHFTRSTMRCCECVCTCRFSIATSTPLSLLHPS